MTISPSDQFRAVRLEHAFNAKRVDLPEPLRPPADPEIGTGDRAFLAVEPAKSTTRMAADCSPCPRRRSSPIQRNVTLGSCPAAISQAPVSNGSICSPESSRSRNFAYPPTNPL